MMPPMVKLLMLLTPLLDQIDYSLPSERGLHSGLPGAYRSQISGRQGRRHLVEPEGNVLKEAYMRRLKDRIMEGVERRRTTEGNSAKISGSGNITKRGRRIELEEQVERSVPWEGDSWRNRVKEYLEERRASKQGGFKVQSREDPGSGDNIAAEVIEVLDEDVNDKEKIIPSTFLSPPGGNILVGDNTWKEAFNTDIESTSDRTTIANVEITTSEVTTADLFENLTDTTKDLLSDLDEVRELSVKAKTTLEKLKQFKNATQATKCQSAADCKSNQVCYLPTNECKDQLTFSLREQSSCDESTDCKDNEVCYLNTKKCVCNIGYIEQSGDCVHIKTLNCTKTTSSQVEDTSDWGVHPYCSAWGHSTEHGDKNGKLEFGSYESGTGVGDDAMVFSGGSKTNCGKARRALLYYECYCDEYSCTAEPAWNQTSVWWGEFNPCVYSAYVFTPLACESKVG